MASPPRAAAGAGSSRKRNRDDGISADDMYRSMQVMETTFITIHDLTQDANILYASTSISDVLDYRPADVIGRSCWDYFHPDEIPFARAIHGRGIELDKASVLNYCRIKNKYGDYVGCECVFTVVYNVLIGCTSVYMDGPKAKKRAVEAPVVRQLFSSSPRDPRYHMLQYISAKFASGPRPHLHEPRAALFLNRFTRTLTINFATNGLERLLGISASELTGQSFYYCIRENCLAEAIRCLESAKANDSIAYLRFWFRDPRQPSATQNEIIDDVDGSSSDEDGGVQLAPRVRVEDSPPEQAVHSDSSAPPSATGRPSDVEALAPENTGDNSRHSSGNSTDTGPDTAAAMFDHSRNQRSSTPRSPMSLDSPEPSRSPQVAPGRSGRESGTAHAQSSETERREVELEAVVSCTSDGLVVIVRAARPFVPDSVRAPPQRNLSPYSNGLFASPWATHPILPDPSRIPDHVPRMSHQSNSIATVAPIGTHPAFSPPQTTASIASSSVSGSGPPLVDFMNSIRDVAVFAWALTGINGSLHQHGRGRALVGSIPHSGLPVWDPDGSIAAKDKMARQNQKEGTNDLATRVSAQEVGTGNSNGVEEPTASGQNTTSVVENGVDMEGAAQSGKKSTLEPVSDLGNKVSEVKAAEVGEYQVGTRLL